MDIYQFWNNVLVATAMIYLGHAVEGLIHFRRNRGPYINSFLVVCLAMTALNLMVSLCWIGVMDAYFMQPLAHFIAMIGFISYFRVVGHHVNAPRVVKVIRVFLTVDVLVLAGGLIQWMVTGENFAMSWELIPTENIFFHQIEPLKPSLLGDFVFGAEAIALFLVQIVLIRRIVLDGFKEPLIFIGIITSILFCVNDIILGIVAPWFTVPLFSFSLLPEVFRFSKEIRMRDRERIFKLKTQVDRWEKISTLGFSNAGLAHDVANVLTVISGNAAMISSNSEKDEKRKEKILRNIDQTMGILHSYRVMAGGRKKNKPVWVPINEPIKNAIDICGMIHKDTQVDIVEKWEGVKVETDPSDILILVYNLVKNGFDSVRGLQDADRWIDFNGKFQADGSYQFWITNGGFPWRPLNPDLVFDLNESSKEGDGSGLGLQIVGKMAEIHEFKVWLDTTVENTRFVLSIPAAKVQPIKSSGSLSACA